MSSRSEVPSAGTRFIMRLKVMVELKRRALALCSTKISGEFARAAAPLFAAAAPPARFRDFVPVFMEVHLEGEAERRPAAEQLQDLPREPRRIDQVLAIEFIIDLEDEPAQRPIDLPLD